MANENHSSPIFSVITGVIGGVYAFIQNYGFLIENAIELFKVIIFGLIGGACGYIGKHIMEKILNRVKEKSKDVCK